MSTVQVINEVFDPFQMGLPRDKSVEMNEPKPFYPVGGRDLSNYRNNTIRIVSKGLNQHLHLSEGWLEFTWQLASTPLTPYVITAGLNDTFLVADNGNPLATATVAAGSYANIAALNTAVQNAITAAGQTGANFVLSEAAGLVVITLSEAGAVIDLNSGNLGDYLGFTASQMPLTGAGAATATVNTQECVMHDSALSLFRKASLWFNNVQVHSIDYPSFAQQIRNLQDYSSDYVSKRGEEWFYVSESQDLSTPLAATKISKTTNNVRVRTQIPLKRIFPFLDTYDKVIRGVEIRVEMERNDYNPSEIIYASRATGTLKLNSMEMWIPEIKGSPAVEAMLLEDVVNPTSAVIAFDNHEVYRQLNPPQQQFTWVLDTINEVPKMIYVGMQRRSQLDSINPDTTLQINPSTFQNFKLVRCEARVNGHVFPKQPYDISFEDATATSVDNYSRLYWEFLRANYKEAEHDNGSLLEYTEQYKNVYPILTFNMSRDGEIAKNLAENNNLEIFLQFSEPPPEDLYVWADVIYENRMKLSTDGRSYSWSKL